MPITHTEQTLRIRTPFLRRDIDLGDGPFSCDVFVKAPGTAYWKPCHHKVGWGLPFEAAVRVNDQWRLVGPARQRCNLWAQRGGSFAVTSVQTRRGSLGDLGIITCVDAALGLEVTLHYEASDQLPLLRKQVRVRNIGDRPVTIQNLCVEIFYAARVGRSVHFLHDFRQETCGESRHFAGYADAQFPGEIDVELAPRQTMESFNFYTVITPEPEQDRAVWMGRSLKALAPWALESQETSFQFSGFATKGNSALTELERILDDCQAVGFEKIIFFWDQLFTNTGDFVPRPDLFPNGESDLRRLVEMIRNRGMVPGVYASYSIAFHGSEAREKHLDWECCDEHGQTFDPGGLGNMCFLSGWGDYVRGKFQWLCDLGFGEIQIDGPTDIPCHHGPAEGHDHNGLGNYHYRNWLWEKRLFADLHRRGVVCTIPRGINYLLMGAASMPGGYCEEDFCHSAGLQLLANYRAGVYNGRAQTPAWATWGFLALGDYHGHNIEASEENPLPLEHGLASLLGYGHCRAVTGPRPFFGPRTRQIVQRWLSLYKTHRHLFTGDFVRLAPPDGKHAEAVLFTDPQRREALLLLINPDAAAQELSLLLPMHYAGVGAAAALTETHAFNDGQREMRTDARGDLFGRWLLKGHEVKVLHFQLAPAHKTAEKKASVQVFAPLALPLRSRA